ncbi:Asp-tRNA(Asn)/Glu-tRNA(Gln) amidotransferase subunit GatB [Patescibacteria group bacterium]|nr:Asp-tRNA(Asn)/Glu-tRNA(Gln) amidotransferase subunit GatB [Patescibacteria group bacterium]
MKLTPIIGLEVHIELSTHNKMFCNCLADHFGTEPNTQICPVCLGMPGTLPVPNKQALINTIKIAKALNCKINNEFIFARKHYFYPDLPKGYQITQFQDPVGSDGWIEIGGKKIRINRVHIEEDTGKLLHEKDESLVDFNRAGVPLVEIVSEPDFHKTEEVIAYLKEVRLIVRNLAVAEARMERGQMRLEPNISLTSNVSKLPDYKVEVKNINSFRFVKGAIKYEIKRQTKILAKGKTPKQETRGYDSNDGKTFFQRSKETTTEYRYFPEPDIPPVVFEKDEIEKIVRAMPETRTDKIKRFVNDYQIKEESVRKIVEDKKKADYFEAVWKEIVDKGNKDKKYGQQIANFIINKKHLIGLPPKEFAGKIVESMKTKRVDENILQIILGEVLEDHQGLVGEYKQGKHEVLNFLIGKAMSMSKGKLNAIVIKEGLIKRLN